MTHLKHREPATDLPSTSTSVAQASSFSAEPSSTASSSLQSILAPSAEQALAPTPKQLPSKPASRKPSRLSKLGRAIAHHPNISQTLLFLTATGGATLVLLCLLFKGAWSDRHNNPAIISAILKMELAREDVRVIESAPERVVTHSFDTLEPHVEADGWEWINRFGNTITYGKQDQRMIASCSPYSPLYMICDLGEIPK